MDVEAGDFKFGGSGCRVGRRKNRVEQYTVVCRVCAVELWTDTDDMGRITLG